MLTIFAISQDGIHAVTGAIFQNNTQYSEMNISTFDYFIYLSDMGDYTVRSN